MTAASAADWYVDAVNGHDDWDGTRPFEAASGTSGPRKTLAAAMPLAGEGDTVHAAAGTYDEGEMWLDGGGVSNRVVVLRGRRLVATAGREKTIIKGKPSSASGGFGPDALRCVLLQGKSGSVPGGIVKGFTITGGYTSTGSEDTSTCGGGVSGLAGGSKDANGLAVACDITGNYVYQRGANVYCTTLLRCRVGAANKDYDFYHGCKAIDSLFDGAVQLYRCIKFFNCTFLGNRCAYSNLAADSFANDCLFLHPSYDISKSNRMWLTNCLFRVAAPSEGNPSTANIDASCRFGLTAEALAMAAGNPLVPSADSPAVGAGNLAVYLSSTNGWLQAWQDEFTLTDYYGRPRLTDGTLDIGCCQHGSHNVYVDAVNGNDANGGLAPDDAKRTLQAALDLALPGDVVYAAEGVYDEGVVRMEGHCDTRVAVMPGKKLVARGRRSHTVIMGALATDAGGPNLNGCGTNAVRCVFVKGGENGLPGGIVKGFTLKNGRTYPNVVDGVIKQSTSGDNTYNCGGGAIGGGLVVDCDFVDCGSSSRGPNAENVTLLRCRVGQSKCGELDCYQKCTLIDTLYDNNQRVYERLKLYNCTFTKGVSRVYSLNAEVPCVNCLFLSASSDALGPHMHYTNCIAVAAWPASPPEGADYDAATCRFGVRATEVGVFGMRPWRRSITLGAGSLAAYLACTNDWSDAWREEFNLTDCAGGPRVVDGKISVGCCEYAARYVDAVNGDDANDGLTPATARRTLVAAIDPDWGGGTVEIAPGVYEAGVTNSRTSLTRVLVPSGWAFEGAGRGLSVIKGVKSTENENGLGSDAVRCAVVETNAYLRGVTLQGGRTPTGSVAGGAYLDGGALIDSEVADCNGGSEQGSDLRGSAVFGPNDGCLIRTYLHDNAGSLPVFRPDMVGCVHAGAYYGDGLVLNSWISGGIKVPGWNYSKPACNCVILGGVGRGYVLTNCVMVGDFTYSTDTKNVAFTNNGYDAATCVIGANKAQLQAGIDAKLRPIKGSMLVDAGNRILYDAHFPAAWRMFRGEDIAGGARVLNGEIDIGAGEYNWMDDFAQVINPRHVSVGEAGENVAIREGALVFSPGDTLTATWTSTRSRWVVFAATAGSGTLTITANGSPLAPENGTYRFLLRPGENTLHFAYAGAGTAQVRDFALNGLALFIR